MYEIWLAMNIAFEIAWDLWPALLPLALVWATVMLINRKKLALVSASSLAALAVLVALAAVLALPSLSKSTLADMGYWVDWAALLGMAAGMGVAAAVLLWPVLVQGPDAAGQVAAAINGFNAIAPGEIDTAILSPGTEKIVETIPLRRLGQPAEVAKAIWYLCTEQSSYVTGSELMINGGQHV